MRTMDIDINSGNLHISFRQPHESDAFGVVILAEDSNEVPTENRVKELIPGLWYMDERYDDFGPDYEKYVEKLIKKNKYLKKK
ncbi:MAG: hypothetical protein JXA96_03030 [Sedimentisphaerales bacterium]|nr:hypothetical protein [Sedimentisphaerales bacterium]